MDPENLNLSCFTSDIESYTNIVDQKRMCYAVIAVGVTMTLGDSPLSSPVQRREALRTAHTTNIQSYE